MFKKKTESTAKTEAATPGWARDPQKAAKFFEHARTTYESTNYQYAMQLWLQGLKHAPDNMDAVEGFFRAAASFAGESKKGPDRSVSKALEGKEPTARYVLALLDHGVKPLDVANALKAFEIAAKLDLMEPAYLLGERAMAVASRDRKPKKDTWVKLMSLFSNIGVYDKATQCGERAVAIDPSDGPLQAKVRNMSAEATMSNAGFGDKGVETGGFQKNIRNIEQQQQLDEEDRIAKDSSTQESLIQRAEADYASRPDDVPAAEQLIRRLLERGEEKDEVRAYHIAKQAHETTGKASFRVTAGDINLKQARRKVAAIRAQAKSSTDEKVQKTLGSADAKLNEMELKEYEWRVAEFPSDNSYRLQLATRLINKGERDATAYEAAIPLLQKAKSDVKLRADALRLLGEAFSAIGFLSEAVASTREALATHGEGTDAKAMGLQYALLLLLKRHAKESRDVAAAEEAEQIASKIAIQDFGYRDIREQRDEIKALLTELRSA